MRIVHLTPGTGSFHCGSCLRDNALIRALRVRGHDALMVPLYLPLVTDGMAASPEQGVQAGGISLFITQKMPWFAHMPAFVHRFLNKPERLRYAAKFMGMTSAKSLGEMTVGSLLGEKGRQWGEWKKLVAWLKTEPHIDVISLSNSLLMGLAKTLKAELNAKVVVSLQGEDSFLDTLPDPYRTQAWDAMRENAQYVTKFVAPSRYYADLMQQRLGVGPEKMSVVFNGLEVTPFPAAEPDPNFPIIGFFARMIHGKGLTLLVDAFIDLVKRGKLPRVKLKIGGAATSSDEKYIEELKKKLKNAGCLQRVSFHPNLTFDEKVRFFRDLTVFSVPATYGEAFGLYVIEAVASGIPVVQPDHGAFPELLAATRGGMICKPDDAVSLADALETLLLDDQQREQYSLQGMATVREEFTATRMAEKFEEVLLEAVK
ncbi:MAG: hypothetical protein JWO08_1067 [Verrucomicrobiaceae bacterium]|nr:hypothetical protein [Verrucomicrobiaceae bacterium]